LGEKLCAINVENWTLNQRVLGSSPSAPTIQIKDLDECPPPNLPSYGSWEGYGKTSSGVQIGVVNRARPAFQADDKGSIPFDELPRAATGPLARIDTCALLAASPDGCTEAHMLARGHTIEQMLSLYAPDPQPRRPESRRSRALHGGRVKGSLPRRSFRRRRRFPGWQVPTLVCLRERSAHRARA
jgi:hypothetical protein